MDVVVAQYGRPYLSVKEHFDCVERVGVNVAVDIVVVDGEDIL